MMLAVDWLYITFIMLRYIPSVPTLLRIFHKWMLNFVTTLLCIYSDECRLFTLRFVNVVYHIH